MMVLCFGADEGRTQTIYVRFHIHDNLEWVGFKSILLGGSPVSDAQVRLALAVNENFVGASLQMTGPALAVVNYQLLGTIDGPEIDHSLRNVGLAADAIEKRFL